MRALFLLLLFLFPPFCAFADSDGLTGKVMCGYQGWFRTPNDGSGNGWFHYGGGRKFEPGACNIDLWPDVRELPPEARVQTPFQHPDGSTAEVYSSVNPAAIALHFKWMKEYHIDGVFLQRFATTTKDPRFRKPMDAVLDACRKAAQENGRCWVPMYDLSGLKPGNASVVIEDWKRLVADFSLTDAAKNPALLRHRGKPLVALWGLGFSDRPPMLDDWKELVRFFKNDAAPGGCTVMLGVPTFWRTLERDAITDPVLHEIIASADVVSPWTVGRYNSPKDAGSYVKKTVGTDLAWCREKKLDYLPVAFPGFS
ncbi:MAG TPA: glycoside hydrolase family 71/99-like protein, partial [Verrucomicrobiales bacterium]|nr:glycoside hydrolase family 71/99-like protein [Verrucomicrobiales bacterium]